MNALFRKEWRQIASPVWTLAAASALGVSFFGSEMIPLGEPSMGGVEAWPVIFTAFAFVGAAIGFLQFQLERAQATESYLVHRSGGYVAAFRAKCFAAWAALPVLLAVGLATFVARTWLLDPNAAIARWDVLIDVFWLSLGYVPAHALAVLASQLRANVGVRITCALYATGGTIACAGVASQALFGAGSSSTSLYLAVLAALTAVGLTLARRMFAAGDDGDLPFAPSLHFATVLIALALSVPIGEALLFSYQRGLVTALETQRPWILADQERNVFPARETNAGWRRVDVESGEPIGAPLEGWKRFDTAADARYWTLYAHSVTPLEWNAPSGDPSKLRVWTSPFLFSGSWQHVVLGENAGAKWGVWFGSKRRELLAYRRGDDAPVQRFDLQRPDHHGFSDRTVIVYGGGDNSSTGALVDLGDQTAWRVDLEGEPKLVPLSLPDGDRIVGVEQLQGNFRARFGLWEPFGYSDRLAVVGERGLYIHVAQQFLAWKSDQWFVEPSKFAERAEYLVRRVDGDRVSPVIAVLDPSSGRELLSYDYAPRRPLERALAAGTRILGLAHAPLATAAGLMSDDGVVRDARTELALFGTRPIWYVHFAFALFLAFDVRRRLGDAPSERVARALWIAATLLFGFLAWVACRALEPRRPRTLASAKPAPLGAPLIVTA
ncbi:MAG: hypothetical protein K8S98_00775 [Planctomycetes bacterium]|nr:hypothetical protein [Planctomycetota bacterium]